MVLDTGATPSYLKTVTKIPTKLTNPMQVATPSRAFTTNKKANILIRTGRRTIRAKALFQDKLPTNLLSVTPIVERLGALILDQKGAALLSKKV